MYMGLFSKTTKAEYDRIIAREMESLGNLQARLASAKAMYGKTQPSLIASLQSDIAYTKARIAKFKEERKSAPK